MIQDYLRLAVRNLRRRGIRSWLTLLGILIGVATVVALISLGDGLKLAILSQFGISSTEVISVQAGGVNAFGPPGQGVVNRLTEDDVLAIERLGSVETAIPRIIETLKIEFNDKLVIGSGINVPGSKKRDLSYKIMDISALSGKLLDEGDDNKVVLGNNFMIADKNGLDKAVRIGDLIKLNGKKFQVKGILKKKGSFIFDNIVLLNEAPLKEITQHDDTVSLIGVKVQSKEIIPQAKEDIERLMRKRRHVKLGEEDFEVSTPDAILANVNQILTGVQIFIVMIALISILVGCIGIINTMTTSVLERVKEIGVMKAIGAKNSDIFLQFFIEAGLLGLVGGGIGCILGISIGYFGTSAINLFLGASGKATINWWLILFALVGSFLIGSISGITPALRAARQKPVEALRT